MLLTGKCLLLAIITSIDSELLFKQIITDNNTLVTTTLIKEFASG